jgi:hypothetical protein
MIPGHLSMKTSEIEYLLETTSGKWSHYCTETGAIEQLNAGWSCSQCGRVGRLGTTGELIHALFGPRPVKEEHGATQKEAEA